MKILESDSHGGYMLLKKTVAIGLVAGMMTVAMPAQAKFISVDPVQFDPNSPNPAMFNRYAYANNDPINMIDPNGEEAWLISRPLGSKASFGQNHMFVAVRNDSTGAISQFSYGPQGNPITNAGKLVNLNGQRTGNDDRAALNSFLDNPAAAAANGIAAELINAPDADVIASGNAVNAVLGTRDSPASSAPGYHVLPNDPYTPNPMTPSGNNPAVAGTANSNSAAYAVANRANPSSTQPIPNSGNNPGQRQHRNIPRTGTRIKRRHRD